MAGIDDAMFVEKFQVYYGIMNNIDAFVLRKVFVKIMTGYMSEYDSFDVNKQKFVDEFVEAIFLGLEEN